MPIYELKNLREKELLPGFIGKLVHTQNMTLAYWEVKAGSRLPEHAHLQEQVTHVIVGSFEMQLDGETTILEPGRVAVIPAHAKHSGIALTDCSLIDVFQPVREDYKALMEETKGG